MNLTDTSKDFVSAVKKTVEYRELKQAVSILNKNPLLKKKVEEIVRQQQELMFNFKSGQHELKAELLRVNGEFEKLSGIPEVKNYLTAGTNFNRMMSQIFKTINASIEHDLQCD